VVSRNGIRVWSLYLLEPKRVLMSHKWYMQHPVQLAHAKLLPW